MSRKRICLLTMFPEGEYQQRVMPGIFSQCAKYDYDVVVVSPLIKICASNKDFLHGELDIFEMVNFDLFDGVIVTPITMTEDQIYTLRDHLLEKIKAECTKPVVSIDMPFGDYPVVYTDDRTPFYHITQHLIKEHGCKNISVLGGLKSVVSCRSRIQGVEDALKENGLELNPDQVYEGDFWYTSGEMLGNRYIIRELDLPDAVVCFSDHMAIGLTNYLIKHGIKVPDQVIVTGYEAVKEASMNTPPITSYAADQTQTGALAVNYLNKLINPGAEEMACPEAGADNLCIGGTCGCQENYLYTRERLTGAQLNTQFDYGKLSSNKKITLGMLLESYMTERLTGTESLYDCFSQIYEVKYLIKPFERFYICMKEDWLTSGLLSEGTYTSTMNLALSAERNSKLHGTVNHVFVEPNQERLFDLKEMLPALQEEYEEPQVFYFVPVHFLSNPFGYAVLQNNLSEPGAVDDVFRNFMRNIDNALEMTRAKYQIKYLSEHDIMTGLFNRRGMENYLAEMRETIKVSDSLFIIVIDMDDLKLRNDHYGHTEGDTGIIAVANAVSSITEDNEICVRGGGDEFFIIGYGDYTEEMINKKLEQFDYFIEKQNETLSIPVSASRGYAMTRCDGADYQEILDLADAKMYKNKQLKKGLKGKK